MQLFKYLKQIHLEKFMAHGTIRIGTLLDYRQDVYGNMITDEDEGIKIAGGNVENMSKKEVAKHPVLSHLFPDGAILKNCEFSNIQATSENLYIYSTSASYSLETHIQWLREENYDACMVIHSPNLFINALSETIRNKATYQGSHKVIYHPNKSIDIDSLLHHLHPAILKPGKYFNDQNEIRAIWLPRRNDKTEPVIIDVPNAIAHCSVHRILE